MTAYPPVAIVEDDRSLRIALIGLLRSSGYDATGFASADDFLQSSIVQQFCCVISDIQMPGMTGLDLKTELVARKCLVPVIMITARNDPDLRQRAIAAGAAGYLRKPFDGNELLRALDMAVKGGGIAAP